MRPYYEEKGIQIWHGDCREVWAQLMQPFDVIITDPPYGIQGMKRGLSPATNYASKGDYDTELFEDTPEYVRSFIVPLLTEMMLLVPRCVLTPGQVNMHKYPEPAHTGAFFYPASTSISRWGMRLWQPIFYYGKDPYVNQLRPDGKICYDSDRDTDHPCPKPIGSWKWLVNRASLPGDWIIDPFMGSGTTLLAAKDLGRNCTGIEIEERYCEIAAKRLAQEVLDFSIEPK